MLAGATFLRLHASAWRARLPSLWVLFCIAVTVGCKKDRPRPYLVTGEVPSRARSVAPNTPPHGMLLQLALLPLEQLQKKLDKGFRIQEVSVLRGSIRGKEVDVLSEKLLFEVDKEANLHALRENSQDQGVEAWQIGDGLVVRFRDGKPVYRKARGDEGKELFEKLHASLGASFELLERFVVGQPGGQEKYEGRSVRVVTLALAQEPEPLEGPLPPEKRWRADIRVTALAGRLLVDDQTGLPLFWELRSRYEQPLRGDDGVMEVDLQIRRAIDHFGDVPAVVAPADTIASPSRTRYELDKRELLDGLVGKKAVAAPR